MLIRPLVAAVGAPVEIACGITQRGGNGRRVGRYIKAATVERSRVNAAGVSRSPANDGLGIRAGCCAGDRTEIYPYPYAVIGGRACP